MISQELLCAATDYSEYNRKAQQRYGTKFKVETALYNYTRQETESSKEVERLLEENSIKLPYCYLTEAPAFLSITKDSVRPTTKLPKDFIILYSVDESNKIILLRLYSVEREEWVLSETKSYEEETKEDIVKAFIALAKPYYKKKFVYNIQLKPKNMSIGFYAMKTVFGENSEFIYDAWSVGITTRFYDYFPNKINMDINLDYMKSSTFDPSIESLQSAHFSLGFGKMYQILKWPVYIDPVANIGLYMHFIEYDKTMHTYIEPGVDLKLNLHYVYNKDYDFALFANYAAWFEQSNIVSNLFTGLAFTYHL
jgi:hypothetical protein